MNKLISTFSGCQESGLSSLSRALRLILASVFVLFLANAELNAQCQTCCNGSKPKTLIVKYNGLPCSASVTCQAADKWSCTTFAGGPTTAASVYITASKNSDGSGGTYFAGTVNLNADFTANSAAGGSSTFPSNTYFRVFSSLGGTLLQLVKIHTSCSTPLVAGDQFGSLFLKTIILADNTNCSATPPPPPGCNNVTCGGEIMDNEIKCTPFDPAPITEATPPCGSGGMNCFKVDPPVSGSNGGVSYTVNFVNGEPKSVTVTGSGVLKVVVKGGPNSIVYTNPPFTNLTAPINPNNGQTYGLSHFTICVTTTPPPPAVDCCNGSKPKSTVLRYTGQSCGSSNTTQPLGTKWECSDTGGGPNGDPSVYITASKNSDGTGGTYFAGNVSLNATFTATSAAGGSSTFPSNVWFNIYASQGGALLQRVRIHYSCSAPLVPGEQFGSLVLEGVTFENNTSCGTGSTPPTGGTDCCNGSKPKSTVLLYNGQACGSSNTTQPLGTKWSCADYGGGPNGDPSVYITVSKNADGTGGTYFAGNVSLNGTFTPTSAAGGASTFPSNVFFNIYASQGGTLLQRVQIHYSCSAPLVPGEQFGSLVLQSVTFADNTTCGLPAPPAGDNLEYRWLRSTTGCPTSDNQVIAGATSATFDPATISQTTWYVRQVRRVGCTSVNDWVSSNCIVKRVVNINATVTNKICDGKGTSTTADDTYTFVLTVTGGPGGGGWTGSFDNAFLGVFQIGETPYGTPITLGPFPAGQFTPGNVFPPPTFQNGVDINVHVNDVQLASCKSDLVVISTGPCSPSDPPATLGNFVWNDLNQNGAQNVGEPGVQGVTVKLFKCDGTFVSQQTTDQSGQYLFTNLAPNMQYFVEFSDLPAGFQFSPRDAAGDNIDSDPNTANGRTDCTFLSPSEIDLTVDAGIFTPTPQVGSIGDFVWNDLDQDGVQDPGEPGVPNVTVQLKNCSNVVLTATTTNANGFYNFPNLTANCYRVGVVLPGGFQFSPQNVGNDAADSDINPGTAMTGDINLAAGQNDPTNDAGIFSPPVLGSLGDFVWFDGNQNGVQDFGEPGVPNVTVQLKNCSNAVLATTTTNATGFYNFPNLFAGCYRIGVVLPPGFTFSPQNVGNDATDSDVNPGTAMTGDINLAAGQNDPTNDAGIFQPVQQNGSIGDCVWNDQNQNGLKDIGEPGVPNITVKLLNCSGVVLATTTTNATGFYSFTNLPAGGYIVEFSNLPAGFQFTTKDAGNDSADSDANPATGRTDCFNLASGQNDPTKDAGIFQPTVLPASVGDFVWNDLDKDGIQDPGEPGVQGVVVKLFRCDNTFIGTTTTNANGFYQFTNVAPGSYFVQFSNLSPGFVFSPKDAGLDDTKDSDVDPNTGNTACFNLVAGQNDPTRDAGVNQPVSTGPGSVGDFVWFDTNANGIQDPGEPGIPNVFVILETCAGQFVNFATTNAQGAYLITNVQPGSYRVKFASPGTVNGSPVQFTTQNVGSDDTKDSDPDWLGFTQCFTLGAGQVNLTLDAGFVGETPPPICVINATVSNVVCNNGQVSFTLVVNGSNTGAWGYDIPALNQMMLPYGQPYNFTIPGSSTPTTLQLVDHDVAGCTTTVAITSPPPCNGGGGTGSPCDGVTITGGAGSITVGGLNSPIEIVKIFNSAWLTVFECTANCANPTIASNLPAGTYHVKVQLFSATWQLLCTKEGDVTVSSFNGGGSSQLIVPGDGNEVAPASTGTTHLPAISDRSAGNATAAASDFSFSVFPNPASGFVKLDIRGGEGKNAVIQITDLTGREVKRLEISELDGSTQELDLRGMYEGLYFVRLLADGEQPQVRPLRIGSY